MTIDILPTIAHLSGAKLPDHPIDGKNIWPLISGEPQARSPHEAYYFYWGEQLHAVRMGPWKLHFPHDYRTLNGRPGGTGGIPTRYENGQDRVGPIQRAAGPGRDDERRRPTPDVVAQIQQLADRMRSDLGDAATKTKGSGRRSAGRLEEGDARFHWRPGQPLDTDAS